MFTAASVLHMQLCSMCVYSSLCVCVCQLSGSKNAFFGGAKEFWGSSLRMENSMTSCPDVNNWRRARLSSQTSKSPTTETTQLLLTVSMCTHIMAGVKAHTTTDAQSLTVKQFVCINRLWGQGESLFSFLSKGCTIHWIKCQRHIRTNVQSNKHYGSDKHSHLYLIDIQR